MGLVLIAQLSAARSVLGALPTCGARSSCESSRARGEVTSRGSPRSSALLQIYAIGSALRACAIQCTHSSAAVNTPLYDWAFRDCPRLSCQQRRYSAAEISKGVVSIQWCNSLDAAKLVVAHMSCLHSKQKALSRYGCLSSAELGAATCS